MSAKTTEKTPPFVDEYYESRIADIEARIDNLIDEFSEAQAELPQFYDAFDIFVPRSDVEHELYQLRAQIHFYRQLRSAMLQKRADEMYVEEELLEKERDVVLSESRLERLRI